jgi:zinc transport system substrate-binding protein
MSMAGQWRAGLRALGLALAAVAGWGAGPSFAKDLNVVVTLKPIHSLAAAVMEGVGEPKLLVDGASSPHTFTLKPSDAKALNAASVIFRVSESLEPFTGRLARSLPKKVRLVTLESTPGLTLWNLRTGETFEAHDHGPKGHGHGHGHSHAHDKGKAGRDGHIWLDPGNAKLIASHIAEILASAAPAHAERFRANASRVGAQLDALVPELEAALRPVAGQPYLVFHDAYQYLERRFGLAPVGSVTVSPDVPPSAKRLSALRGKIAKLGATCVFAEPQFEPRIIAAIVEGTTAKRGILDPLGASIPAGPGHYPALMRAMAENLSECLRKPA